MIIFIVMAPILLMLMASSIGRGIAWLVWIWLLIILLLLWSTVVVWLLVELRLRMLRLVVLLLVSTVSSPGLSDLRV